MIKLYNICSLKSSVFIQKIFDLKKVFLSWFKISGFEKKKIDKKFFYKFYLFLIKQIYSLFFTVTLLKIKKGISQN